MIILAQLIGGLVIVGLIVIGVVEVTKYVIRKNEEKSAAPAKTNDEEV